METEISSKFALSKLEWEIVNERIHAVALGIHSSGDTGISLKAVENCIQQLIYSLEISPPKSEEITENEETSDDNKSILFDEHYWNEDKTIWKQPPVPIKHGDLVDIGYGKDDWNTVIGRYIGKGMGVAIIPDYSKGDTFHVAKVKSRGLDRNPRLVSDEKLFEFIED